MRFSLIFLLIGEIFYGYTQEKREVVLFKSDCTANTEDNIYEGEQYYNRGGSIIRVDDDLYHLFYSR